MQTLKEENKVLLEALADISNMCIGNIAKGYKLDSEEIGKLIYRATGLTNPQLNHYLKNR